MAQPTTAQARTARRRALNTRAGSAEDAGRKTRAVAGKALAVFLIAMAALTWSNRVLEDMTIAVVSSASVQRGALTKQITAYGTLEAKSLTPVITDDSARVLERMVETGAVVAAGDTLMTLDYTDAIKQKADALESARSDYESKLRTFDWAKADMTASALSRLEKRLEDIAELESAIAQAETTGDAQSAAAYRSDYDHEKAILYADKTARDYLTKQTDYLKALDKLNDAKEDYNMALAMADSNGAARVIAPITGTVTEINAKIGSTSAAGSTLAMICDASAGLSLKITVDEDQASALSVGDMAEISAGGTAANCQIEAITASASEGMYDLLFTVPGGNGGVGMRATVRISKRTQNYDALIPISALRSDSDGDFVYVVQREESSLGSKTVVHRVDVTVLDSDSSRAAVSGGVSQRDTLASRSDRSLSDGDRVRVEE